MPYVERVKAPVALDADAWQREVIESPARIKVVMGGRGVGKTVGLGRNVLIKDGLETQCGEFAYFGPSYATGKREARAIAKHRDLKPYVESYVDSPFPTITFRSGSQLYFRSLDREENVLGYHLDGAIIDEIHKIGERALDETVRPQVAAKRGWLLLMGQHDEDGVEGWINKRFFEPGQLKDQNRVRSWRIPSSLGRMFMGEDGRSELELIRSTTPEFIWRWQYLAEAVESENKAFRSVDLLSCLRDNLVVVQKAQGSVAYAIGYDLGKVVDPSASVILEAIDREHANVANVDVRPLHEKHEMQALHLARLARLFGDATAMVDATGQQGAAGGIEEPDAYVKYYRQHCPSARAFILTPKNKARAVQNLQLAVEQGRLGIPKVGCEKLVDQLRRYRWELKGGAIDYHGPDGHDDDLVMALVMAWYAVERGWFGKANPRTLAGVF
jgi:hypothetical protein